MQAVITDVDPFDLPEWLGTHDVVWRADQGLRTGHLVRGRLTADADALEIPCDLLAVDEAYPEPVVDDAARLRVHQAWRHGQVVIGELDGPVGTALATLTGDQVKGHSRVFALLNTDIMVRPVTLCVSKVTVDDPKYTNILMGTVQFAIANGVLDAVREGILPKDRVNDLGIICSVWLAPTIVDVPDLDHKVLFDIHRKGMTQAIRKAMANEPSIDWLLENQDKIVHKYYQMGLDGKI